MAAPTERSEYNGPTTSDAVLRYVPKSERDSFLKLLIASAKADDLDNILFVASLAQAEENDRNVTAQLLLLLERAIQSGYVENAVSVSLKYLRLGSALFQRATDVVVQAKSALVDPLLDHSTIQLYLRFCKACVGRIPSGSAHSELFQACLDLLQSNSTENSWIAKDIIFGFLSASHRSCAVDTVALSYQHVLRCVEVLILSKTNKSQPTLGYSLWLRLAWISSSLDLAIALRDPYWQFLLEGLRYGDSERRKMCLQILKITMSTDSTSDSTAKRTQYDRYCTVFETIILGRYINQVQECENDLDALVTDNVVEKKLLHVLLASALDTRMQGSNRKYMGDWTMRSDLKVDHESLDFFRDNFLPWVVQGQYFVSSLVREGEEVRCAHGERLVSFLARILRQSARTDILVDTIVDMIDRRRHTLFAYATVYLLTGVSEYLRPGHMERIADLGFRLPEAARDCVQQRTRTQIVKSKELSRRDVLEQGTLVKIENFDPSEDSFPDLWDDLEYLEFPKKLLVLLPSVLFQPALMQRAAEDPTLAERLQSSLESLQTIAETRVFLVSALVPAIREAVLTTPKTPSAFDIGDFILRMASHPPEPTIDFMLEEAIIHLTPYDYAHYFGERKSHGLAAYIDLVSRLQQHPDLVASLVAALLQKWKEQSLPPPVVSPWKTTLQLQTLLLCLEQHRLSTEVEGKDLLHTLLHILAVEPLPRYRYLLEWMIIRLLLRYNELKDVMLTRLGTKDHHSNPKYLASLMKIGMALAHSHDSTEAFALQLAAHFVSLAASSKVVIRHEAQWQVPMLMDLARNRCWPSIADNWAFVALDEYIRSLERFNDPPSDRRNAGFDPEVDHNLTNLVEGRWFSLDDIESPLTSREELMKVRLDTMHFETFPSCMELGDAISRPRAEQGEESDLKVKGRDVQPRTSTPISALQTKGKAYLDRTSINPAESQDASATDCIVIGSLVENPHNLGGLSRVAEIFGASALYLQDRKVLSNKDFTNVAVSSHLHLTILPLSPADMPAFVAERRSEGFTIVGIEQTDRSVILGSPDASLPEKVVLVVGSEKEGIPAMMLTECDLLVEIPQKGITRSLNVQTAVSIVLYEHARQHNGKGSGDHDLP